MVRADMPLIADGAMGTELLARSGFDGLPCRLNLLQPELVLGLHREYLAAGAQLLVANTLGATPEEAHAGLRLAREAADSSPQLAISNPFTNGHSGVLVGASLACRHVDAELLDAVAEADLLLLETVTSLPDLYAAVERAQSRQPLLATLSFDRDGTLHGLTPAAIAGRIGPLGLAGFGYGCGFGPAAARSVLAELRGAAPNAILIAKPNLGLPPYTITPAQLASWAGAMVSSGIQVIGACCGSTPAHIQALAGIIAS
jgi:5-methyltetrahydrofolate--homocysteine methyltransferase